MADKIGAREEARRLLQRFGVKSAPVPVERIAKSLQVRVQYAPLDGDLSGMSCIKDGIPVIGVNSLHHPNRQRFTLAHELAHVCLHRGQFDGTVHVDKRILNRDALTETGTDPLEVEANAFASELLIPDELLRVATKGQVVEFEDDDVITNLARQFRVSESAMRYRLFSRN
jgi:Zn-dependent peptidase ImmA (M78 family)